MPVESTLTIEQRRKALQAVRKDLELTIYSLAASLGVDADEVQDLTLIGALWHDTETDLPGIDPTSPEHTIYNKLIACADRLELVVEKLEGPNRI